MKKMMQYFALFTVLGIMGWMIFSNHDSGSSSHRDSDASKYRGDVITHYYTKADTQAKKAAIKMRIGAAEVVMRADGSDIFSAIIEQDASLDDTPEFLESISGETLNLTLNHTSENSSVRFRDRQRGDKWTIFTRPDVPFSYDVSIGAGSLDVDLSGSQVRDFRLSTGAAQADINLSNSLVESVEIRAGVGSVSLDISGTRPHDLDVSVSGGIGALTVYVPEDAGVLLTASGLGSVTARNFSRDGRTYTNNLWGTSANNITLNVSAGIGSITVVSTSHR